jgi:hypothetical protein
LFFQKSYDIDICCSPIIGTPIKERTNSPPATFQQNAYAMNILRSRLESRINFIINSKGKTEHYQELAWVLGLVEKGEPILNVISDRVDCVQYLDDFLRIIISNAALSINEVRDEVEQTVEAAEVSLSGLYDAISKMSTRILQDLRQEFESAPPVELSTLLATGKTNTANKATFTRTAEREENVMGERKEHAATMTV